LSRPNITGRVLRAQPALLGASLTCAAALTVGPLADADVAGAGIPSHTPAVVPGITLPPPATTGLPDISGTPADGPVAQLIDPAPLPVALARAKLRIRRLDLDVLDGSAAVVAGRLRPDLSGRTVDLQRLGHHGWRTVAKAVTRTSGRFILRYTPRHLLTERVRVLFAGDSSDLSTHRNLGRLSSYRLAGASWYGGAGSLACGGELSGSTMGVANKTLPCGTLVTLRYGGHSVRVPVVDRGPYVAGRDFDLTEATKRALGFEGVGEVWSTR
jgi:rare lipoprotein A